MTWDFGDNTVAHDVRQTSGTLPMAPFARADENSTVWDSGLPVTDEAQRVWPSRPGRPERIHSRTSESIPSLSA